MSDEFVPIPHVRLYTGVRYCVSHLRLKFERLRRVLSESILTTSDRIFLIAHCSTFLTVAFIRYDLSQSWKVFRPGISLHHGISGRRETLMTVMGVFETK